MSGMGSLVEQLMAMGFTYDLSYVKPMGSLVEQLMAMGFTYDKSAEAIRSTEGDMEAAVMMLLSAPEDELAPEPEPTGPVWNDEWDELLVELEEMGFEDSEQNRALITENNGDVKDTVKELVNRERLSRQ